MGLFKIIGIVLLIVGVVALVFGIYNLVSFSTSAGGKIANKTARAFGGQTKAVKNAVIYIVIGAVCAGAGFFLYRKS